jgi:hypothetical protein
VPGPLEARRRLGKRRMAYASDSTPTNPLNLGSVWDIFGFLGEKDRTKFTYEAPTPRSQLVDRAPERIPRWLSRWIAADPQTLDSCNLDEAYEGTALPIVATKEELYHRVEAPSTPFLQPTSMEELCAQKILDFRESSTTVGGDRRDLCNKFSEWLCQSVRQGDLSKPTLESILSADFIHDIQQFFQDPGEAKEFCFLLVRNIWEDIRPGSNKYNTHDGAVVNRLLSIISEFSLEDVKVRTIAEEIVLSLSRRQLVQLRNKDAGFYKLVGSWALTWVDDSSISRDNCAMPSSDQGDLDHSHLQLARMLKTVSNQISVNKAENNGVTQPDFINSLRLTLSSCKESIADILRHVELRENEICPIKSSVMTLSKAMNRITNKGNVQIVVQLCLAPVLELCENIEEGRSFELRCHWMSVIASMPAVNSKLFRQSWNLLNMSNIPSRQSILMNMLLKHWKSRGCLRNPELVNNDCMLLSYENKKHSERRITSFVHAITQWEDATMESRTKKIANLITSLAEIKRYRAIYLAISQLHRDGISIPVNIISTAIHAVTNFNVRRAYIIYNQSIHIPSATYHRRHMTLRDHQELVLRMIGETTMPPSVIWDTLRIPMYSNLSSDLPNLPKVHWPRVANNSEDRLSPEMLEFVGNMAITFAWSKTRPSRVALRNVMQCADILRVHNAPLTRDITKAFTHAGLTRQLVNGRFVSLARLKWTLSLIEWVEGTEVAETVDEVIYHCRDALKRARRHQRL